MNGKQQIHVRISKIILAKINQAQKSAYIGSYLYEVQEQEKKKLTQGNKNGKQNHNEEGVSIERVFYCAENLQHLDILQGRYIWKNSLSYP